MSTIKLVASVLFLVPVIFAARWVSLVVHEAGHAIVARLLGYVIFQIRLGDGDSTRTYSFGRCAVVVGPWPDGGEVWCFPPRRQFSRWRSVVTSLAGPAAGVSLAIVALACFLRFADAPAPLGDWVLHYGWILVVVPALSSVFNLLPFTFLHRNRRLESDGLSILKDVIHRRDPSRPDLWVLTLAWGARLCGAGRPEGTRFLRRGMRNSAVRQNAPLLTGIGTILHHFGEADEAAAIYRDVLSREPPSEPTTKLRAAEGLAAIVLNDSRRDLDSEALTAISAAAKEFPDVVTVRGTLGALLFEAGETRRAEDVLTEVAERSSAALDRGIAAAYLAVIHGARGNSDRARAYRAVATSQAGDHPIVRRILSEPAA